MSLSNKSKGGESKRREDKFKKKKRNVLRYIFNSEDKVAYFPFPKHFSSFVYFVLIKISFSIEFYYDVLQVLVDLSE